MISIKVLNKDGITVSVAHGEREVILPVKHTYGEGDRIIFETDEKNRSAAKAVRQTCFSTYKDKISQKCFSYENIWT